MTTKLAFLCGAAALGLLAPAGAQGADECVNATPISGNPGREAAEVDNADRASGRSGMGRPTDCPILPQLALFAATLFLREGIPCQDGVFQANSHGWPDQLKEPT